MKTSVTNPAFSDKTLYPPFRANLSKAVLILTATLILALASCNNGGGGNDETSSDAESVTYESKDSGGVYVLVISKNTGRVAYSAKANDPYDLTYYPTSGTKKTSSGKVTSITGAAINLEPSSPSITITITITISAGKMTALAPSAGKIKWDDGSETDAPAVLEAVIEASGLLISNGVLIKYTGKGGNVTIPHRVTSIGKMAFERCTSLTGVTIPNSVTSIGYGAFAYCTSLASVTIPDSVTIIGDGAFASCESLASVTIPNSVTSIGNSAFGGCTSLAGVTIPDSVTSIGKYAFANCESLASVTFQGTIAEADFNNDTFRGDLRDKFYATDTTNGTPGTYTISSNRYTWTKSS